MGATSNKKVSIRRWISSLMIIVLVTLMVPAIPAEASARSIAIAQYKKLLSKSRISVLPQGKMVEDMNYNYVRYWSSKASDVKFFLCYIDGDDVPEIILRDYHYGYGVWTYKNGFFRCMHWDDRYADLIGYYKKRCVYRDNSYSEGTPFWRNYYKLQTGKKKQMIQYVECNDAPEGIDIFGYYIKSGSTEKKVSSSAFYKNLRNYTKGTSMSRIYLHNNTAANRKKYLK